MERLLPLMLEVPYLYYSNLGNDTHEGRKGHLTRKNYAVATDVVAPCITGIGIGHYNSNVFSGGVNRWIKYRTNTNNPWVCNKVSSGNIERGKIYLFGIRNA